MNAREFDKVVNKLGMETRNSSHHHAWLVHDGITVVRTKRSHGNNKFVPEHLIRKQLHVDQEQFAGLHSCTVSKEEYIKILIEKKIIVAPKKEEAPTQQNPASEEPPKA